MTPRFVASCPVPSEYHLIMVLQRALEGSAVPGGTGVRVATDRQMGLLHKNGHVASGKPSNSPGPRTRAVAIPGLEEKNLQERSEKKENT